MDITGSLDALPITPAAFVNDLELKSGDTSASEERTLPCKQSGCRLDGEFSGGADPGGIRGSEGNREAPLRDSEVFLGAVRASDLREVFDAIEFLEGGIAVAIAPYPFAEDVDIPG